MKIRVALTALFLSVMLTACSDDKMVSKRLVYISQADIPNASSSASVLKNGSSSQQSKNIGRSTVSDPRPSNSTSHVSSSSTVSIVVSETGNPPTFAPERPSKSDIIKAYNDASQKNRSLAGADYSYKITLSGSGNGTVQTGEVHYSRSAANAVFYIKLKITTAISTSKLEYYSDLNKLYIYFPDSFLCTHDSFDVSKLYDYLLINDPSLSDQEVASATETQSGGCIIGLELSNFEKYTAIYQLLGYSDAANIKSLTLTYEINNEGFIACCTQSYLLEYAGETHFCTIELTYDSPGKTVTVTKPSYIK